MKILVALFCALGFLAVASEVTAQGNRRNRPTRAAQPRPQPAQLVPPMPVLPDIRNDPDVEAADIAIIANITAKELRFDVVGDPTVEFLDKAKNQTIWEAQRFNLPDKIEPGVTYRNIGIRLKITSRFADIDRIVAEALGEVPINETKEPPKLTQPGESPGNAQKPATGGTASQKKP